MLQGGQKISADAGNFFLQDGDELLYILAAGTAAVGTGAGKGRQVQGGCGIGNHFFRQVDQGPDYRHFRPVQIGDGEKTPDGPGIKHVEEQGLDGVIQVVGQGDLADAQPPRRCAEGTPAHIGTEGTGIFFLPVVEDNGAYQGFLNDQFYPQVPAQFFQGRSIHIPTHIYMQADKAEIYRGAALKPGQEVKKEAAVLSPRKADGNLVTGLNHLPVVDSPPDPAGEMLHRRILPFKTVYKANYTTGRARGKTGGGFCNIFS
jgi:hypothetical protein